MADMEFYWEAASCAARILGILIVAVYSAIFVRPFLNSRRAAPIAGTVYFFTMVVLWLIPLEMQGVTAHTIGCAVMCMAMYALDAGDIRQKIVLAVFLLLFEWIVYGITLLFWDAMYDVRLRKIAGDGIRALCAFLLAEFLFLLLRCVVMHFLVRLTVRLYSEGRRTMTNREFVFMLLPILPCLAGYYLFSYFNWIYELATGSYVWNDHREYPWITAFYQICCGGVILAVILVNRLIKRQQREEREKEILEGQIAEMRKHIHEIERVYGDIRSLRHDMRNHVMVLESLYGNRKWEEAEAYSDRVKEALETPAFSVNSGNPVTDILLDGMRRRAGEKGIPFESGFVFETGASVDVFDISVILDNALTNAIEGAERAGRDEQGAPYIRITSFRRKNAFIIEVVNRCAGDVVLPDGDGLPATSKRDSGEHGFGLSNIRKIARKYHGDLMIQIQDGEFILTVMLMLG